MVPEIWSATDRIFCHYGPFFALLPLPPLDQENQNFEKMKKTLEDIIILQMSTINDSHMLYGFSDTECNKQSFFLSFWTVFCPFTPLTALKTEKIPLIFHHFTQVYQKS